MNLNLKETKDGNIEFFTLICIIISSMASFIVNNRSPWSFYGIIGGLFETIGALGLPLVAMILGNRLVESNNSIFDFYKKAIKKFIIPLIVYSLIFRGLTSGSYRYVGITNVIISLIIVSPFLQILLKNISKEYLKILMIIFISTSAIMSYYPVFGVEIGLDLSFLCNWSLFCFLGHTLVQIQSEKIKKRIYRLGIISFLLIMLFRTIPIETNVLLISPTMILFSSAVFLWLNNLKLKSREQTSIVSMLIRYINKHNLGIYFAHNYIIIYFLYEKFDIHPNMLKVVGGSSIVFVITLILTGIITAIVDWGIIRQINVYYDRLLNRKTLRKCFKKYKHYLVWIISAMVVTFIIEYIGRGTIVKTIEFTKLSDHKVFISNFLIVLVLSAPSILFNRMYFFLAIVYEILISLSLISVIMVNFRGTPLTYSDTYAIIDGLAMAKQYVTKELIIIFGVFILCIVLLNCKIFSKKIRESYKISKVSIVVIILTVMFSNKIIDKNLAMGILAPQNWDMLLSYDENGFVFSIYDTYKSYKREKPVAYSKDKILEIKSNIDKAVIETKNEVNPNIIIVQLESVMDPYTIEGIELSDDPIKNIRKLSEENSSGVLSVPTFGGGTARTEFEVLTGMSLDYFSPGEIPHNTYLKKQPVESLAYVLDSKTYEKTFIHNFQGNFYERNKAYENLGFDRYIPMEYMENLRKADYFPYDDMLFENIIATLESTEKKDFIFGVGVQTHGAYNLDYNNDNSDIKVTGTLSSQELNQIQDYVDDLTMVDEGIRELVEYVGELNEPTILVVYSDHLPALEAVTNQFVDETKYLTPYFIYDNIGLEQQNKDIEAYELTTHVLELADISGGIMNRFHSKYRLESDYKENLECIQYDMLHGKQYIYDGESLYQRNKLKMGLKEITIDSVNLNDNRIEVLGFGFTEFSRISVNGKQIHTEFISENKLIGEVNDKKIDKIKVNQVSRYDKAIGSTEFFYID